jgi:uncharacterized membrane protein YkvA (DUF1232 family)
VQRLAAFASTIKAAAARARDDLRLVAAALGDSRTPIVPRLLIVALIAYVASPIDLIPDFIPVLGLIDDVVLVPLGVALVLRLLPPALMADLRAVPAVGVRRGNAWAGLSIVAAVWLITIGLLLRLMGAW